MKGSNMPSHMEIREFAIQLGTEMNYSILDESPDSRVVLLSSLEKAIKLA
jgi:wyosine [tRNA(Phe)-imidazoG37] synthetase (radical SAM superfamily)